MAYADVSVSNAESRQTKLPQAFNYQGAFNVGGTQNAAFTPSFDAGSDTSTPKAVSAQGGPATLNDASPIAAGGGKLSTAVGAVSWPIIAGIGAGVLVIVFLLVRR